MRQQTWVGNDGEIGTPMGGAIALWLCTVCKNPVNVVSRIKLVRLLGLPCGMILYNFCPTCGMSMN